VNTPFFAYAIVFVLFLLAGFLRARLDASVPWKRFFDMMFRVEVGVVTALLLLLVAVGFLQIVLRNFFQTGLLWGDPLMRHAVLWLGCFGASLATAKVRHINIDVFTRLLPDHLRPLRRVVVYGMTALICYILAVAAFQLVQDERQFGDVDFLGIKTWTLQLALPIAFAVMCYRSAANLFLGREEESGESTQ